MQVTEEKAANYEEFKCATQLSLQLHPACRCTIPVRIQQACNTVAVKVLTLLNTAKWLAVLKRFPWFSVRAQNLKKLQDAGQLPAGGQAAKAGVFEDYV